MTFLKNLQFLHYVSRRSKHSYTYKFDFKPSAELKIISSIFKEAGIYPAKKPRGSLPAKQPIKKFARKQLYADYLARQMETHTLTLFIRGKDTNVSDSIRFRSLINEAGFEWIGFRNTEVKAAVKYYFSGENEYNYKMANMLLKGKLSMICFKYDINDLFRPGNMNLENLRKNISFSEAEREAKINPVVKRKAKDIRPWDDYHLVCAFLKETDKNMPWVWLSANQFTSVVDNCASTLKACPDDYQQEFTNPHTLVLNHLCNSLNSAASSLVDPLERSLSQVPNVLTQSLSQFGTTLMQVCEKKKSENST